MKLSDLCEAAGPFVKFGSWTIFDKNEDIEGFTNFGVPASGPALIAHTGNGKFTLSLCVDPDGYLAPATKIICVVTADGDYSFKKSWPDSKDGYKAAKAYAEKLRKGEDPTT